MNCNELLQKAISTLATLKPRYSVHRRGHAFMKRPIHRSTELTDKADIKLAICEDALVAIGDIALSGKRLQEVEVPDYVSGDHADATAMIFTMIEKIAGAAAELATPDSDT